MTIITGTFQQASRAKHAMRELARAGLAATDAATFRVSARRRPHRREPPAAGSVGITPDWIGHGAASGALFGAAIGGTLGLVTRGLLGPQAGLAGAGVLAYLGSLYGGLAGSGHRAGPALDAVAQLLAPLRGPGVLVTVSAAGAGQQASAMHILRANGARQVERPGAALASGRRRD